MSLENKFFHIITTLLEVVLEKDGKRQKCEIEREKKGACACKSKAQLTNKIRELNPPDSSGNEINKRKGGNFTLK